MTRPDPTVLAPPPGLDGDQEPGPAPLQFLLPVLGATSSVVLMVVLRNGQPLYLVVAGLVFVVAVIGGAGFALTAKGRAARTARVRRRQYLDYLEQVRRDLTRRAERDRARALVAHPDCDALVGLVADPTRLWERRRGDLDYLTTRVGLGPVDWFDLAVPAPESPVAGHDPHLAGEVDLLLAHHATVAGMPVTVDLAAAAVVAVIGPRHLTTGLVRALVAQLVCHHGPDDLSVAAWFDLADADDWAGLDLLPHAQEPDLYDGPVPARRVAPSPDLLREVLGTTLADRLGAAHAARRTSAPTPPPARLVVIGDDHDRPALRLTTGLDATSSELGVTTVHVLTERLHEPDDVDVRIECTPQGTATLTWHPGRTDQQVHELTPDIMTGPVFTATARALAPLRLADDVAAPVERATPDTRRLLGLDDPDHLFDWSTRTPQQFLQVPFGLDDHGAPVHLDLKEAAQFGMGPHGLCVGATGSGKSEMLRTLILALITTHSPDDLSMILVDYKGGAAFAPFAGVPHLAGLIDNLADDPHLTTRARASITGEVVRRQRLLKDAGSLPSIGAYRAARAERADLPAMPHLLLVVDEFGELLTAEPEFVDLFLQIGRIGRSIGVHLLLASQRLEAGKLRGLDTYLSYRVGLRTFSDAESQLVLGNTDAYQLPALPGYGYLKVDTSVYTRFRAGYVSAPARRPPHPELTAAATRVRRLGPHNGPAPTAPGTDGATPSTSGAGGLQRVDTGPNLVDAVVTGLRDAAAPVPTVWLPPLPDRVPVAALLDSARPAYGPGAGELDVVVGLLDDPAHQQQDPWVLDLTRSGGHVAVVGAPGSGRTTFLRTLTASLAVTRTPTQVGIYGLDLTGAGLTRLEQFPHVGGIATRTDPDKVHRLVEELTAMLATRERVFATHHVESTTHLRALHAAGRLPQLPTADVIVLVDGYGQLRTDFPDLDDQLAALITRGPTYGLHLVATLTRWSDLRIAHQALIGTRAELRLNDPGDSTIDRKLATTLPASTPGRILTDDARFAQVALPVLDLVDDDQIGDQLTALAVRTAASWTGPHPAPIRLLPTDLPLTDLPDHYELPDSIPIGRRQDTMDTATWDLLGDDQHLLVLGDTHAGKTAVLRTLIAGLLARFSPDELAIAVVDARGHTGASVPDEYLGAHATTPAQAAGLARSIAAELAQRPGRDLATRAREPRIVILVDDHDIIAAAGTDPLEPLLAHLPAARDLHLHVVLTRPVAGAARALYQPTLAGVRDTGAATLILSGDRTEGPLIGRTHAEHFPPGRGRYLRRGAPPFIVQVAHDGAEQPVL